MKKERRLKSGCPIRTEPVLTGQRAGDMRKETAAEKILRQMAEFETKKEQQND